MILWRLSNHATLDGTGALAGPGRWHNKGMPIVYLSEHPALALVETMAHLNLDPGSLPREYQLLEVEIPDAISALTLQVDEAASINELALTREAGDQWLQSGASLLLKVPSLLLPCAWNYLLNPRHPDYIRACINNASSYPLDDRIQSLPSQ